MNKQILNIAIPNIISNITIPLLGIVDIALVGHLDSKVYIGAIALGTMIFNFIYWGFSFLRMGTSGFTAQALGQRNLEESTLVLTRAMVVAFTGAILLLLLQIPISWLSFNIINGSKEVEYFAKQYFFIRIWAAPATIGLYAITGWFIGMQNARFPMIIAIIINILNIVFNILLVKVFEMKASGVALGTVIAQYSGLIISIILLIKYYGKLSKYINFVKALQAKALKLFYSVNKDIFIRTILLIVILSFFTAVSASKGDTTLAVNTLLLQFFTIFSYITDGFAYAGEAIAGKYYGARDKHNLKKATKLLFLCGVSLALIFTIIYYFFNDKLILLFTDNKIVIEQVKPYLFWTTLLPLASFSAFIWDGIYIGATASAGMRNSMLISSLVIFLPSYYIFNTLWGNNGLWFAFLLFLLSRGVAQSIMAKKNVFNKLEG
ncbi:MAG: MATE family efflux transporter [Bacteroidales bacterium]|jgi:MATE family multidrug resistance protein|nr:MATE family efflux transporter [Bacteroidales bacterium]